MRKDPLRSTPDVYRQLFEQSAMAFAIHEIVLDEDACPVDYIFLDANPAFEKHTGLDVAEIIGRRVTKVLPGIRETPFIDVYGRVAQTGEPADFEQYSEPLKRHYSVHAYKVGAGRFATLFSDITERKEAERQNRMSLEVLGTLNRTTDNLQTAAAQLLPIIQRETGIEACAIRMAQGNDFRYVAHAGFSETFVKTEDHLCSRNADGTVQTGTDGRPMLKCTCGLVLQGQADRAALFSSPGGSVWVNDSAQLCKLPTDLDPRLNPRNLCMKAGYQSIALIPIRSEDGIIGLLQLNDHRPDRFSPGKIAFLEAITESIGVACARAQQESAKNRLQSQLSTAQEIATLGSWEYDVGEDRLLWSDETYHIFGLSPGEFKASYAAFQETIHPDDRPAVVAAYAESLRDADAIYDIEHRIVRRDTDEIRHVHERCIHHRDTNGNVVRSFGMVQDITIQKRLEIAIREHNQRLEQRVEERTDALRRALETVEKAEAYSSALFASIPDPIFVLDREGRFLDCKVHSEAKLLVPSDLFINRRFHDVLPPTVAEPLQAHLAETFAGRSCRFEYSLEIGGETRFYEASLTRMDADKVLVLVHDVTVGRQRESQIQQQASLIRSLLDSIPDIIFFKDRNGVYLGCNPPFESFVGRTRDQIIGRTDYDLFSQDVADAFREKDKLMLDCNEPRHNDEWITYPDGRSILIDTLKTPYKGADGERIGILGISRDITERHRSRERLQTQERLYRGLVESQSDLIVRVDQQNRFTFVNDAYCQMFNQNGEALIGSTFTPMVHPDDIEHTLQAMKGLSMPPHRVHMEQRAMTKDGWRWISWEDSAILDERGNIVEIQGIGRDITELKQAMVSLEQLSHIQEHLMRLAKGLINVPVTGQDAAINQALGAIGELIDADRAYLMSYDFETGLICNTHEWCNAGIEPQIDNLQSTPMEDVPEWVAAHKAGRETLVPCVSALSPEDPLRHILEPQGIQSLITLPLTGKSRCLGFIGFDAVRNQRDWTDEERALLRILAEIFANFAMRRELEQNLTTARDHAESANQAKSEFLASMSHELRTPLNAVIGFAEAVEDPFYGDLNEKQRLYIGHIRDAGQHLLELINDVLDLSKVEAGGMDLEIAPVNLGNLLKNSLVMISERCHNHGISLALNLSPALRDKTIEADARKMKQILYNLLSNAAKFTPDRGSITLDAERVGGEPSAYVEITVTDTGVGFPSEYGDRIFEPFFQIAREKSGKTPGTGLGLPLTRQFVELHGGTLRVESEGMGKGCRASFRIPNEQDMDDDTVAGGHWMNTFPEADIVKRPPSCTGGG